MPDYRLNEIRFDVPDHWTDQSITAFRLPAPAGGAEASFVVTRDTGKGAKPFSVYIDEQVAACTKSLPGLVPIRSDPLSVEGRQAWWLEFTWDKDDQPLQLRQIFFDCGYHALICTLTSTPRDLGFHDPAWHELMASLRFDRVLEGATFQPGRG